MVSVVAYNKHEQLHHKNTCTKSMVKHKSISPCLRIESSKANTVHAEIRLNQKKAHIKIQSDYGPGFTTLARGMICT